MAKVSFNFAEKIRSIADIEDHHQHLIKSVNIRFSQNLNSEFNLEFIGLTEKEISKLKDEILQEIHLTSTFNLLTHVESVLRCDFIIRCQQKKKDALSKRFRSVYKPNKKIYSYRLKEDILDPWLDYRPNCGDILYYFTEALKFRHWMAHGRYWKYDSNWRKYNFDSVFMKIEQFHLNMDCDLKTVSDFGSPKQ